MVNTYREALRCEVFCAQVFSGDRDPLLFGTPEPWMALLLEALRLAAQDRGQESQTLREQAFDQAPAMAGKIDGEPFAWIADADQRLGPVLEAIINGRYYLVPFHTIRELVLEAPTDLRDLVWTPAHITWTNEGQTVALIPTRYPGSEAREDGQISLARRTEWTALGSDLFIGQGQRMLQRMRASIPCWRSGVSSSTACPTKVSGTGPRSLLRRDKLGPLPNLHCRITPLANSSRPT